MKNKQYRLCEKRTADGRKSTSDPDFERNTFATRTAEKPNPNETRRISTVERAGILSEGTVQDQETQKMVAVEETERAEKVRVRSPVGETFFYAMSFRTVVGRP